MQFGVDLGGRFASDDPCMWPVTRLAAAIRSGELDVVELAAAHLSRIEEMAHLNAVITVRHELLVQEAEASRRRLRRGGPIGPLHGVPFTVKDVITTEWVRSTAGSRILQDNVPSVDATAVSRLKRAGALLVGKTNCPEFAFGIVTDSPLFGRTLNPLNGDRSPGGSSGGESAAVASGCSAFGVGTDFGGSLRWPAQCTGIVALRPTPGLVPGTGQIPGAGGSCGADGPVLANPSTLQGQLQVVGPLARTVADLGLVTQVLAGPDPSDLLSSGATWQDLPEFAGARLTVGWSDGSSIGPVGREMAAAVEELAARMADAGTRVRPVPDAFAGCLGAYNALREIEALADHLLLVSGRHDLLSPPMQTALGQVPPPDPLAASRAWAAALSSRAVALKVFESVDVVVLPVAPGPACDHDGVLDVGGARLAAWQLMGQCRAVSMLGAPAVSVPVAMSSDGMPLSVQVVARPSHDRIALAVAGLIEEIVSR